MKNSVSFQKILSLNLALGFTFSFILLGCKNELANISKSSSNNQVAETESLELETNYGNAIFEQIKATSNFLELVDDYTNFSSARNVIDENSDEDFLTFISNILPNDLSQLKRTKNLNSRTVDNENEEEVIEITLESELNELCNEYQEKIQSLMLDVNKLVEEEKAIIQDDFLILSNGQVFSLNSIETISALEIYSDIDDEEKLIEYSQKLENDIAEIQKYFESIENESNSRAIYFNIIGLCNPWSNRTVYYKYGTISKEHKLAIEDAMLTWHNAIPKINFVNVENQNAIDQLVALGLYSVVQIYDSDGLDDYTAGLTFPCGRNIGSFGYLKLKTGLSESKGLKTTCLHELGHLLGLQHEHQRYDRDNYIYVEDGVSSFSDLWNIIIKNKKVDCSTIINNCVIPEYMGGFDTKTVSFKVLWKTFSINVIYWNSQKYSISTVVGSFDFDSIMLYPGYEIINPEYQSKVYGDLNSSENKYYTKQKGTLSSSDIAAVKKLYGIN